MGKRQHQTITAIVYDKKGRVLSIGKNSYVKTHPLQFEHAQKVNLPDKVFLHAEIAAIVKCRDLDSAHRIFVSRWYKDGTAASAKPCPVCMSAIAATNIKIVEHT